MENTGPMALGLDAKDNKLKSEQDDAQSVDSNRSASPFIAARRHTSQDAPDIELQCITRRPNFTPDPVQQIGVRRRSPTHELQGSNDGNLYVDEDDEEAIARIVQKQESRANYSRRPHDPGHHRHMPTYSPENKPFWPDKSKGVRHFLFQMVEKPQSSMVVC